MEPKHRVRQNMKTAFWLFLLGGGSFALVFLILGEFDWREFLKNWVYNGALWIVLALGNGWIVDKMDEWGISWIETPVKRLVLSVVLSFGFTISAGLATMVLIRFILYGASAGHTLANLTWTFYVAIILVTTVVSLFLHGRGFLLSWRDSHLEAERLKQAHLASQYESLRNQVNPHFLFNSLNVLSSLVYKDADLAAQFIKQLAQVYRYVLDTNQEEMVSLAAEIESLKAYLFLLQIRFGENLQARIQVEPGPAEYIAPLSLQMLVENAIKHNVISRHQPLTITIGRHAGGDIVVSNNLQPRSSGSESLGVGLPNIRERYRHLSERPVRVEQEGGFFRVYLPVIHHSASRHARIDR